MNELNQRIKDVCLVKRLSYKDLAEELGVTPQAIYQILNGRIKNPSSSLIKKFEKIGINPSWMLTGNGQMLIGKEEIQENTLSFEYLKEQIKQKDSIIQALQRIIDSQAQLLSLGKWLDVSYSRFVFFVSLKDKFRYINVMI